jgi:hypothetical protein
MRTMATAVALAIAVAGCGSSSTPLTCGELQRAPGRYATESAKLYAENVGNLPRSDCSAACERNFTKAIERRLRKECSSAAVDHEPERAVADWINSD